MTANASKSNRRENKIKNFTSQIKTGNQFYLTTCFPSNFNEVPFSAESCTCTLTFSSWLFCEFCVSLFLFLLASWRIQQPRTQESKKINLTPGIISSSDYGFLVYTKYN